MPVPPATAHRVLAACLIAVGVIVFIVASALTLLGVAVSHLGDIDNPNPANSATAARDDERATLIMGAIALVGGLLVAAGLWRWPWKRRTIPGKCSQCKYDRTGLAAEAVCPECGRLST